MNIDEKYNKLIEYLKTLGSVLVSYSGGVDSTFLTKVCRMVLGKDKVLAITAVSPSRSEQDIEEAKQLAEEIDVNHELIETDELHVSEYCSNRLDKCYHCKRKLDDVFIQKLKEKNAYNYLINGTNYDDIQEIRPGTKADIEHNVVSPLVEAELTKKEIRELSRKLNLRTWDKEERTCLATRIPLGSKITEKKLKQIEDSEKILRNMGFVKFRVRHLGDTARIEMMPEDFKLIIQKERLNRLVNAIQQIGFKFVSLDLEGYKKGKMNYSSMEEDDSSVKKVK
jgi:pyridinium-3,5-biscarboxylic acid mononucleotide sulfurtransferase